MEISNFGRTLNDLTIAGSQRLQSKDLDQQDFLKLMVAQLRNQDPLEPQDNSKFFTQIAQFNTLDTMREMADSLQSLASFSGLANASALVGRTVTAEIPLEPDPDTGFLRDPQLIVGTVERVTFDLDGPTVFVDGQPIPIGLITEVA